MGAHHQRLGPAVEVNDGDGWVVAADGEPRWGIYGAGGLLLRHTDSTGVTRYFLARRSPHVHHGGTWGIPGGALRRDETAEDGARREAQEEFGDLPAYTVAEVIVEDAGGWSYSTVVADVAEPVGLQPRRWEHTWARWVTLAEMADLMLHPDLAEMLSPRRASLRGDSAPQRLLGASRPLLVIPQAPSPALWDDEHH